MDEAYSGACSGYKLTTSSLQALQAAQQQATHARITHAASRPMCRVAGRRLDLEDALLNREERHVEGAAVEVSDARVLSADDCLSRP